MSIIEEEFNLIFKKYGGLFNYQKINSTDYIEYMLGVFRDIIQLYAPEEKGLPIPHINIIDNSNLNAVVSKGSLGYHIGFNAGTFFLIKDIFGRMMASPNVLVKFGDTSKEETSKLYNAQITDFNILNLASELPDPVVPENYTRFAISDYLATIALVFLVRHEYAHIIMGHIDYLTGEANTFAIEEKEREITNTKDSFSMLLQTLEMDADSFAVNSATEDIIRLSSSVPSGFTKELIPNTISNY